MVVLHARSAARLVRNHKLRIERDMERMDKIWILDKYAIVFGQTAPARPTAHVAAKDLAAAAKDLHDGPGGQVARAGGKGRHAE